MKKGHRARSQARAADESTRQLQQMMLDLLIAELERKRLTPSQGEKPGYRPPAAS